MKTVRNKMTIFIAACLLFVSGVLGVIGWSWLVVSIAAFAVPVAYWRWIYSLSENKYAKPAVVSEQHSELPWLPGSDAYMCYRALHRRNPDDLRMCLTHMFVELFCDEEGDLDPDIEVSGADFVESTSERIHALLEECLMCKTEQKVEA